MELDKTTEDRLKFFDENYIPMVAYLLNEEDKTFLGTKADRKCRFCRKSEPEASFKNIAHAIPEFTGNKKLICYYECDSCNARFSKMMESHMANYMNLWHTFSQVSGKKGVPSFKTIQQKKSRVDLDETHMKVEDHEGDSIMTIDDEKKTITFKAKRASYIPIAIYKCLVKMALTIMPENELDKFRTTMDWINEEDHEKSRFALKSLHAFMSIAPGAKPYPFTSAMIFKRKDNPTEKVPYAIFLIAYGNFSFQVHLPLCSEDKQFMGQNLKMISMPTPIDMQHGTTYLTRKKLDLNGRTLVKGEEEVVTLSFESKTELPPPEKPETK